MKPPLFKPIFIVLGILGFSIWYGLSDKTLSFANVELKKTNIKKILFPDSIKDLGAKTIWNSVWTQILENSVTKMDSTPQKILLTGDSMVEGLMFAFKDYCEENGHQLFPAIWYSSSTLVWGKSQQMKKLIEHYQPTIVFLALGANELFIRNIIEDRAQFVDTILSQTQGVKFIWIGPPNWKKDTGINELLVSKVGNRKYFLSRDLVLARANDGAHSTRKASRQWADSLFSWVNSQSSYPFLLEKPKKPSKKTPNCVFVNGDFPN